MWMWTRVGLVGVIVGLCGDRGGASGSCGESVMRIYILYKPMTIEAAMLRPDNGMF